MPIAPQKSLTISIVSHGQLQLIRPLLEQLDQHSSQLIANVVLTHNIPEADLLAGRQWRFPLTRIQNQIPKGFGANNNQAFKQCQTPWFLILNPDIRLSSDVLTPMLIRAKARSGLLTPRILEPGKTEAEQHRAIITPLEIITRRRASYVKPAAPDWIPGLFMLFRSAVYSQIKGFDERFFMYGEDFDICARTQLAGWQIQVMEDLLALHDAQRASHKSRQHLYWHITSLLKVWLSGTFWRYWRSLRKKASAKP